MAGFDSRVSRWIRELGRRKDFRVAVGYALVAWALIQVAETTFEPIGLPPWTLTLRNSSTRSCGKVCTRSSGTGRPDRAIELLGIAAERGGAPLIPSLQRDGRAPSCAVRIFGLSGFRQAGCVLIVTVWS
jgi:hypothetical protein